MLFTAKDYDILHSIVFTAGYPGYKPDVTEIPNGDGKADVMKRYAHIAPKYLTDPKCTLGRYEVTLLQNAYDEAWNYARQIFDSIGGAREWRPDHRYCALRILDYPPGATSAPHKDFDLFTNMLFRDQPKQFHAISGPAASESLELDKMRQSDPHCHLGELGELIGMGAATLHEVTASETRQRSMVFFSIPDHDNVIQARYWGDLTVREWLNERMARSRTTFSPYKQS